MTRSFQNRLCLVWYKFCLHFARRLLSFLQNKTHGRNIQNLYMLGELSSWVVFVQAAFGDVPFNQQFNDFHVAWDSLINIWSRLSWKKISPNIVNDNSYTRIKYSEKIKKQVTLQSSQTITDDNFYSDSLFKYCSRLPTKCQLVRSFSSSILIISRTNILLWNKSV